MHKHKETLNALKGTDIFSSLPSGVLQELSSRCSVRRLKHRDILFHEGFEGDSFFMTVSGAIRIFKTAADGSETTIKIIHAGEFFAEVILLGTSAYPASAIALSDAEVLVIQKDAFFKMLDSGNARKFIAALFSKMRFLSEKIHYLNSYDVEERFFKFLIDHYGKQYHYEINIPKKDIASAIGTIPETFSRLILRLTKMKIITWEQNTVSIKEGFWDEADIFD